MCGIGSLINVERGSKEVRIHRQAVVPVRLDEGQRNIPEIAGTLVDRHMA